MLSSLAIPGSASLIDHANEPAALRSWADVRRAAAALAVELPGDPERRVYAVQAANGISTLECILSILSAKGIPVPLPPGMAQAERDDCLDLLGATALWTEEAGWVPLGGARRYPEGFELVMHSSGSTGRVKPLAIRLDAIWQNARDVATALNLSANDRHLGTMSQCYMSGLYNSTFLPWVTGAQAISLPIITPLTSAALHRALLRHRPTVVWLSPLIARMLVRLRGFPSDCFESVRFVIACTAPLSIDIKTAFEERFDCPLLQSYGLCETLITTLESPEAPAPGTVGRPVGSNEPVRCDDQDQIVVANGALFAGYLDAEPERTHRAQLSDFETGDIGSFDDAGNLIIEGRLSEIINRNGVKFSPDCVESVIAALDPIEDCALLGYPNSTLGTRLVVCVVGREDAWAEIENAVQNCLPPVQRPHDVIFVPTIPRTPSGKIDRPALHRSLAL